MQREARDHLFLEFTKSVCPDCGEVIDAHILIKNGKVLMKKRCMKHGYFESLLSSDSEKYLDSYKFNMPGMMPLEFGTKVVDGCPHDCGLCPDHQQHSCVGIIEITNACNLRCPTCFASSKGHDILSLDEVSFMLDQFVKQEGNPEVIQFSGGEPTIHPRILDFIRLAQDKKIKYVMINTNGIKISKNENFVKSLSELNPVIYLQFDGFKKETYEKLRGKDLLESKMKAMENLEKYNLRIVLVATIQRGVNEDEIGNLVDFALSKKAVKGLVLQPTFYSGRHPDVDPLNVVTLHEVIKHTSVQSKNGLKDTDFIPNPCCFPTCNASCYLYVDDLEVRPLARVVNVEEYVDFFMNRSVADLGQIKESLKVINSGCCGSSSSDNAGIACCTIPVDLKGIEKNIKVIMVQAFMDIFNFDVKKVMKCCVHEITPNGKIIPFCAFNNIPKYREEVNMYYRNKIAK